MAIETELIIGRVILKKEYKEQDALITVICDDGKKITFKGQGILRLTSKNAAACQLFSLSEFDLLVSKSQYRTLKTARIISTPKSFFYDFKLTLSAIVLSEIIDKLTYDNRIDSYIFKVFNEAIGALDKNNHAAAVLSIAIFKLLDEDGHGLIKNSCCICGGKSNIESIDLSQGGLICQQCRSSYSPRYSKEFLKSIYLLINANLENIPSVNSAHTKFLLPMLITHLEENCGIVLKSAHYIKEL